MPSQGILASNLVRNRSEGAAPPGISRESRNTAVAAITFSDVARLLPDKPMKPVVPNQTTTEMQSVHREPAQDEMN